MECYNEMGGIVGTIVPGSVRWKSPRFEKGTPPKKADNDQAKSCGTSRYSTALSVE